MDEALPSLSPPRPRWHPIVRSILFLLAYFAVEAGVTVLFVAVSYLVPEATFQRQGLGQSTEILLLAVALKAPPLVAITWLFVHFLDRRTLASLGARWPDDPEGAGRKVALRQVVTLPLAVTALVGLWMLAIAALPKGLAAIEIQGWSAAFSPGGSGPAWWPLPPAFLLVGLLLLFLVQGSLEEWVVRGYIYRALKERWRPFWAALASSVLFSLLHAANPNVSAVALFNIILAGLILAALVEHDGSLWGASLAHGVWNFLVACVASLPVSGIRLFHLLEVSVKGDESVTGGSFGPEGSLVLTGLGLALTALLWGRVRSSRSPNGMAPSAPEDGTGTLSQEKEMDQPLHNPFEESQKLRSGEGL